MKKGIAFFDFDGTITTKDTLLEFIKFSRGRFRFYFGFLLYSPYLIAYKLKIISNQKAKEKVLAFFFNGMPIVEFNKLCDAFAEDVIPLLLRPKAVEEIRKLQEKNMQVVIVSASPGNWIQKWASSLSLLLIASQLEIRNNQLTGKIAGKNCHGQEKVRRIMEKFTVSEYDEIYAFGDSKGDLPMLELATFSFFKPFRS